MSRRSGVARASAALLALLLLAGGLLEGCASGPGGRETAGDASGERSGGLGPPAPAAAPARLPPLQPLERLPATAKAAALSTVVPVISDGSVDPDEDAVEPGLAFERGGASWYGSRFQGRRTASGERFDMAERTAAHRTLPFGTLICVRNLANGQSTLVRVNDRGPSARNRVIDISQAAADELAMVGAGVQTVSLSRPVSGRTRCE